MRDRPKGRNGPQLLAQPTAEGGVGGPVAWRSPTEWCGVAAPVARAQWAMGIMLDVERKAGPYRNDGALTRR
jgi:hypothetical protein